MATYPQGIDERHGTAQGNRHASWWRLGILWLILAVALFGFLGGAPAPTLRASSDGASLAVTTPDRLRNGMFFETRISVEAKRPIGDAVIAIPASLWRDAAVNTMIPAPAEEEFVDGEFRFHFGPLGVGEQLGFKIDGQMNPPRYSNSAGRIRLLDGGAEIVALPISLKVIP
ncbi:MAG: hypothetical protein LH466_10250 [Sphingomonas bacterium]|nr:hypothetical protein [Sphingomonas bacterium]